MSAKFDLLAIPAVASQVLYKTDADGSVVLMLLNDYEHYYTIDGISAFAWKLINGKRSFKKILEDVVKEFKLPQADAQKNLEKLVKSLISAKLIRLL
jgi:hypothetical protein